jgi:hypothetical protein
MPEDECLWRSPERDRDLDRLWWCLCEEEDDLWCFEEDLREIMDAPSQPSQKPIVAVNAVVAALADTRVVLQWGQGRLESATSLRSYRDSSYSLGQETIPSSCRNEIIVTYKPQVRQTTFMITGDELQKQRRRGE